MMAMVGFLTLFTKTLSKDMGNEYRDIIKIYYVEKVFRSVLHSNRLFCNASFVPLTPMQTKGEIGGDLTNFEA